MDRREFLEKGLAATIATAATGTGLAETAGKTRPNVLYIFSDQHRAVSMPGEPYNQAIAPNLDAFRHQNLSMENCISNYPLCTPYRGILMTGRWPQQTGLVHNNIALRTNEQSLGLTFSAAGYHTGYVGKWHLSGQSQKFIPPGPERQGFQDWHVWSNTNSHYGSWTYDPDTGAKLQPKGWNCTLMTDQAVTFLHSPPRDKPWILIVSWNPPHPPFNPPAEDAALYPEAGLTFRPNVRLSRNGQAIKGPGRFLTSDALLRQAEQGYYGAISGVDREFARLLKALDDSGQAENTIVIYTSDHGEMMGSQGRMAKQVPFEESCRVPFFIRYPGITPKGAKSDALFAAIDIYPTLCGLAGIRVPEGRGGRNLSAMMRGQSSIASQDIIFLMNQLPGHTAGVDPEEPSDDSTTEDGQGTLKLVNQPGYRGARTRTHTYAVTETGRWCLYDNVADPYQMHNLVADPKQKPLMDQLDALILAWLKAMQDGFPYAQALDKISSFPS